MTLNALTLPRVQVSSLPLRTCVSHAARRVINAILFYGIMSAALLTCAASTASMGCSKEKAYVTAMKSDLRNMVSAQEAYFAHHGRFAAQSVLQSSAADDFFRASTGVTLAIEGADAQSWRARTTHVALNGSCTIDSSDGEPRCDNFRRPRPVTSLAISIDLWLFAFSVRRRQNRETAQGAPYA